jgi:hypothetical protein
MIMTDDGHRSNHACYKKEFEEANLRLSRTKYLLFLALALWPIGLFFNDMVSLLIFGILAVLWSVSTYIAFMHSRSAKERLDSK